MSNLETISGETVVKHVFLTGGDGVGWALDEDLVHCQKALSSFVVFSSLDKANVVHALFWDAIDQIPLCSLHGKKIICHITGEPNRFFALPSFQKKSHLVGLWVCYSQQAIMQMAEAGFLNCLRIPYGIDTSVFHSYNKTDSALNQIRNCLNLPKKTLIIGSFQRDSLGGALDIPKLVKGPDKLVEIGKLAKMKGLKPHFLLAGPRRHWIREKMEENAIGYTFVGIKTECEDVALNTLPRTDLAFLYNLIDVYIIASRSEGGPHAVLESIACGCPVLSTPVGHAPDILPKECLFETKGQVTKVLTDDFVKIYHEKYALELTNKLQACHSSQALEKNYKHLYEMLEGVCRCNVSVTDRMKERSRSIQLFIYHVVCQIKRMLVP